MNIHEVLELARARKGVSSDRALAHELGLPTSLVHRYRHSLSVPNDETMLILGNAAGLTAEAALLIVNVWRSRGRAHTVYRHLFDKLCPDALLQKASKERLPNKSA